MRGNARSRGSGPGDRRSWAAESLSESAIDRTLRWKAFSNPWTVVPLVLVVVAIIGLTISPPIAGGWWTMVSTVVLLISATASLIAFLCRNFLCREEEYATELRERMALQDRCRIEARQAELTQLQERLESGFSSVSSDEGLKALRGLVYEYEQIQLDRGRKKRLPSHELVFVLYENEQPPAIATSEKEVDPLSAAPILALTEETYRQGLTVLAAALRLTQAIDSSNTVRLRAEIAELEKEIEPLRRDETRGARVEIVEATVRSHEDRLALLGQQRLRVDELLYQAHCCEASLARTRIELAVLHAGGPEISVSAAREALQRTIDQAKEVQAELKRLGF